MTKKREKRKKTRQETKKDKKDKDKKEDKIGHAQRLTDMVVSVNFSDWSGSLSWAFYCDYRDKLRELAGKLQVRQLANVG
jgi:hypothetical protein